MTVRATLPRPPAALVDVDMLRSEWAARARRAGWFDRVTTAFITVVLLVNFQQLHQGRWGIAFVALIFLARGSGLVLDQVRERRVGGPATAGASSTGWVHTNESGPEVWAAIQRALVEAEFRTSWLLDAHTSESRKASGWARAYNVTVRVLPAADGGALVTVWSRPVVSWWQRATPIFGRSHRYANLVLAAIPGAHEVVREPQPGSQT